MHLVGIKHHAVDALSGLLMKRAENRPLGYELPVHLVTQASGTDHTAPCLAAFIKAQLANEFCQTPAKEVWRAGTVITTNKEGVLVRGAQIDEAIQKLVLQLL